MISTIYEYFIQGNYGQGWETVTAEDTISMARIRLVEYKENEPEYRFRIKRQAVEQD